MSRLKVGVLPVLDGQGGGIYQYSLTILDALDHLRTRLDSVVTYESAMLEAIHELERAGWKAVPFMSPTPRSVARRLVAMAFGEAAARHIGRLTREGPVRLGFRPPRSDANTSALKLDLRRGRWLRRHGIQLMLYPAPTTLSFETDLPYVMAIHDLQHRIHPEFPEVSADGEFEIREYLFSNGVRHAEAIVVDSPTGREDVLEFYGRLISPDRVRVLPFVPPPYLARPGAEALSGTLKALGVQGRYLLFPAQFWPHKNHRRVTQALAELHLEGLDIKVVMTGSATGKLREAVMADIREIVDQAGIHDQIQILGFVNDTAMAALYAGASGLVLPTFFGPTNIPVIEAWAMEVPVLTSDIRGIREQCGDAAILVDPLSVDAMKDGMRRLWVDEELGRRLVTAGTERLAGSDPGAFREELGNILSELDLGARARRTVIAA